MDRVENGGSAEVPRQNGTAPSEDGGLSDPITPACMARKRQAVVIPASRMGHVCVMPPLYLLPLSLVAASSGRHLEHT
jgi:hypothetical protein